MWPALAFAARAVVANDSRRAGELVGELVSTWRDHGFAAVGESLWLADIAVVLRLLGREGELLEVVSQAGPTPWLEAATAYLEDDFPGAAEIYGEIGSLPDEGFARLRAAEAFLDDGRRAEADAQLEPALAFWRSVGATAHVREGEALLAESA
jgi:hypothetical protein